VKIDYRLVVLRRPNPALGGRLFHYRPVTGVLLTGLHGSRQVDGILDTGADETVFPEDVAARIGIDLTGAEERQVDLIGRPAPVRCRYATVQLQITDGSHMTYEWTAVVAFAATRLRYSLLGHGGFLQFFDADFRGAAHEVILFPNSTFPGTQVAMTAPP
jgi:hypothetical protein